MRSLALLLLLGLYRWGRQSTVTPRHSPNNTHRAWTVSQIKVFLIPNLKLLVTILHSLPCAETHLKTQTIKMFFFNSKHFEALINTIKHLLWVLSWVPSLGVRQGLGGIHSWSRSRDAQYIEQYEIAVVDHFFHNRNGNLVWIYLSKMFCVWDKPGYFQTGARQEVWVHKALDRRLGGTGHVEVWWGRALAKGMDIKQTQTHVLAPQNTCHPFSTSNLENRFTSDWIREN